MPVMKVCVCLCVCARACVFVRAHVCACVCVCVCVVMQALARFSEIDRVVIVLAVGIGLPIIPATDRSAVTTKLMYRCPADRHFLNPNSKIDVGSV